MKTTAKFISASLATLLVSASAVTAFAAETKDITAVSYTHLALPTT